MKEVRRIKAAKQFAKTIMKLPDDQEPQVVSSWGPPYTSVSGTAKKTGVAGLTTKA